MSLMDSIESSGLLYFEFIVIIFAKQPIFRIILVTMIQERILNPEEYSPTELFTISKFSQSVAPYLT